MEKPHFLARKLQESQRREARPYTCAHCQQDLSFASESKLWEHTQSQHASLNLTSVDDAGWKSCVSEARSRAKSRTFRRLAPDAQLGVSKQSSHDSMEPHVGDARRSRATSHRPSSHAMGEGHLDEIKKLSLTPTMDPAGRTADARRPSSASNPRKRSALPDGGPAHTRKLSGVSQTTKDPDFDRTQPPPKKLFDPTVHDASSFRRALGDGPGLAPGSVPGPGPTSTMRSSPGHPHHGFPTVTPPKLRPQVPRIGMTTDAMAANAAAATPDAGHATDDDPSDAGEHGEDEPELLLQPETRPISRDQLVVEVKRIYSGLIMVESKCIEFDEKQSLDVPAAGATPRPPLAIEQWRALITLHKTLLYEHHDFFLASQHPSASPAISKLAVKYSMPARMWRHGIHSFLEVLRHRLPESLEHMLAFLYIAYSMMALLFETVPAFEDTWIECLGDLGRYRMAIVDDDPGDQEVWSGVSKMWYGKAAHKSPTVGRLYHHLAILARPQTIQQLSLYTRSLTCICPFENARSSILTLLHPVLEGRTTPHRFASMEHAFVRIHAILYVERGPVELDAALQLLFGGLMDGTIQRLGPRFKAMGVDAAMTNASALLQYGAATSVPLLAFQEARRQAQHPSPSAVTVVHGAAPSTLSAAPLTTVTTLGAVEQASSHSHLSRASHVVFGTLLTALQRPHDRNVYPMIHTYLVILHGFAAVTQAMTCIERFVPWAALAAFLTSLATPDRVTGRVLHGDFPQADRPLHEDFVMRGQYWSESLYPENWFVKAAVDDEERVLELASMEAPRIERILWLGLRLVARLRWLRFDDRTRTFAVTDVVSAWPAPAMPAIVPAASDEDDDSVMTGVEGTDATTVLASSTASLSEDEAPPPPPPFTLTTTPTILQRQPAKDDVHMTDLSTRLETAKPAAVNGWVGWHASPTSPDAPAKSVRPEDASVPMVNDGENDHQ